MWKKRSQRLSRGSCVVINELKLLIEGGGDEPDLHEHGWGSEKQVAKSGPWKLDPIKNSVYKTHPRKEEAINLYQDWSIRVIRCFLRLGYDIDIGVTKQDPSARLGQKDPSNGTKKRMYALFQVEGKVLPPAGATWPLCSTSKSSGKNPAEVLAVNSWNT